MNPLKTRLLCMLFVLPILNACSKKEVPRQEKSRNSELPVVENGYLKFKSNEQYVSYLLQTLKLQPSERAALENKMGFKSFKRSYDEFEKSFAKLPLDVDSVTVNKMLEANSNIVSKRNNYGSYIPKWHSLIESSAVNENGVVKIGDVLIKLEENKVVTVSQGDISELYRVAKMGQNFVSANATVIVNNDNTLGKDIGIMAAVCIPAMLTPTSPYPFGIRYSQEKGAGTSNARIYSQMALFTYLAPDGSYRGVVTNSYYGEKKQVFNWPRWPSAGAYYGKMNINLITSLGVESNQLLTYSNYQPNGINDNFEDMKYNSDVIAISEFFLDKANLFDFNNDLKKDIAAGVNPAYVIADNHLGSGGRWVSFCMQGIPASMEHFFRIESMVDTYTMPPIYFAN